MSIAIGLTGLLLPIYLVVRNQLLGQTSHLGLSLAMLVAGSLMLALGLNIVRYWQLVATSGALIGLMSYEVGFAWYTCILAGLVTSAGTHYVSKLVVERTVKRLRRKTDADLTHKTSDGP
jgi:hypothetical protein